MEKKGNVEEEVALMKAAFQRLASDVAAIKIKQDRFEEARQEVDAHQDVAVEEIRRTLAATEAHRKEASAQHAARFASQTQAIRTIAQQHLGDRRFRLWSIVIIPAVVVMLDQVVELAKFAIAVKYQYPNPAPYEVK